MDHSGLNATAALRMCMRFEKSLFAVPAGAG